MGKRDRLAVPAGALQDTRLSARDLRVLGALCFYFQPKRGTSSPKRKNIAAWAGVAESHVSHSTKRLESFGWVAKEGNGGRSSASVYRIAWGENGAESGTVSNPENGAEFGTVSAPETVPNLARFQAQNGANDGTVSGNGAKFGTVFPETVPNSAPFSAETVPNLAPATRARIGINKYIYTDPDQIGSEKEGSNSTQAPAFGDYVEVLTQAGMPESWLNDSETKDIVNDWVQAQLPIAELRRACVRATKAKRGGPIGPRYVVKVLRTMEGEKQTNAADGFDHETNYAAGGW